MKLKSTPEDFIVKEINQLHFTENGKYSYYLLKKRNMESEAAIQKISDLWKINPKYINRAGNKDKVAITTQHISISQGPEKSITSENLELTYLGKGNERLNLGMLEGNAFKIIVREISKEEWKQCEKNLKDIKKFQCINYYDDQRFGIEKNNHEIGKLLVKKQWKETAALLCQREHYPYTKMKEYLEQHPSDVIGALRLLPRQLLLLFVHAYQSFLWNETAKEYVKEQGKYISASYAVGKLFFPTKKMRDVEIPILGFDEEACDKRIAKIIGNVMKKENISFRDFLIKQIPELTTAGGKRDLLIDIKDFSWKKIDETTAEFCFTLGKGSYATMVVKRVFI